MIEAQKGRKERKETEQWMPVRKFCWGHWILGWHGCGYCPKQPHKFWGLEDGAIGPDSSVKEATYRTKLSLSSKTGLYPRSTGYVSSGCIRVWRQTAQASFWLPHYVMCASVFSSIEWELKVFLHHRDIVRIK